MKNSAFVASVACILTLFARAAIAQDLAVPSAAVLAAYCVTEFDWRKAEANLNAFPDERYQCRKSSEESVYPKLIYYNKLEECGHFAAWEQRQPFSEELRAGFRPLRSGLAAKNQN